MVKRIKEQDDAKPIPVSSEYVFPGTEAHVAGWGSILFVKDVLHTVLSDNLKELFVTILPNTKCIVHKSLNLSFNQMCARGLSDLPGGPYYVNIYLPFILHGKKCLSKIIRCPTKFPLFFLWKCNIIVKKWLQMNHSKYCPSLSTTFAHRYLQLLPIFLVELEYRYGKSVHLLRLSTNQAFFRCLHMSGTADQPDHVPSTGTSNNRTAQYLGNTAGGVRLPI